MRREHALGIVDTTENSRSGRTADVSFSENPHSRMTGALALSSYMYKNG